MTLIYKYIIKSRNKYLKYISLIFVIILDLFYLPNIFLIEKTVYFLKYFIIGCIIKEKIERLGNIKKWLYKYMIPTIVTSFIIMSIYTVFQEQLENNYIITTVTSLIGCIFWYEIGNLIKSLNRWKEWIKKCGKYSLQLYLLNGYFLVISRTFLINVCKINNAMLIIIVNTLFCIIPSVILIDKVFMRFKILRFISGCNEIKRLQKFEGNSIIKNVYGG